MLPKVLHIETTRRCNLRCPFCHQSKIYDDSVLSYGKVEQLLNEGQEIQIERVGLYLFGEPLLDPDFVSVLSLAVDKFNGNVFFHTNGTLLRGDTADKIARMNFDHVTFSVTGFSDKVYGNNQGYGPDHAEAGKRVYENILSFSDLIRKYNSATRVNVHYILSDRSDSDDLGHYIDFWKHRVNDILISDLISVFGENPINVGARAHDKKCGRMNDTLAVHANGQVSPCCTDWFRNVIVGDIYKQSLKDIVRGDAYRSLLSVNARGDTHCLPAACRKCDFTAEFPYDDCVYSYKLYERFFSFVSKLKNDSEAELFFYAANKNMSVMFRALKAADFRGSVHVFDSYKEGEICGAPINKPSQKSVKGKEVIVFAEKRREEVEGVLRAMEAEPVFYQNVR